MYQYQLIAPSGQTAVVTVPYMESEYRSMLMASGSGMQIGSVLGRIGENVLGEIIGNVFGGHMTAGQVPALPPPPQLPVPAGGSADVNIPGVGYFPSMRRKGYYNREGKWINRHRPRMNVLNPRALKRAMRRVSGFASFAKRTISFTKKVRMKKRGRR